MILQALYDYYQRNKDKLPPKGFQSQEIKFVVQIDEEGKFFNLLDKREGKKGTPFLLPKAKGRSGSNAWKSANLLWDHYGYLLAHPKDAEQKSIGMAKKQQKSFVDLVKNLPEDVKTDAGVKAVLLFFETRQWEEVKKHQNWNDCAKIPGCNLSFQVLDDNCLVPERDAVKRYQMLIADNDEVNENDEDKEESNAKTTMNAVCLITGQKGFAKRLHTATPIAGSKSNAKIVAFQKNSGFDSYFKEQAFNAPVSYDAEAAYSAVLKYLIKSEQNRILVADSTIIFWAQKQTEGFNLESEFCWYFRTEKDDTERGVGAVRSLYEALNTGKLPLDEGNRFYVLGLAPNAARISVRFWKTGTVRDFAERIKQHFDDFAIVHGPKEYEYLALTQILSATALEYKMDNVPPNLAGEVIVSILAGTPYPQTLLQQCIRRIRAEQQVNRARAAILKACINRVNRFYKLSEKEVTMSLDRNNVNAGYRLGRLFAVFEKIQEEASPGINATIRERFYGAASATPITVFPQLLKLKNHHLAKLNPGRKVNFEKEIGEIFDALKDDLPAHLTLDLQSRFAVGYYHQRQDFFKKKDDNK